MTDTTKTAPAHIHGPDCDHDHAHDVAQGHVHGPDCNHGHGHHHHFSPVEQFVRASPKVGRNDPCPCGSGKKHKKCCGAA